MAVTQLDDILGGMVAGTWVNSMLLAVEFIQVRRYFRYYPKDPPLLRYTVAFSLLLSVECTIGNYANVYMFCVTNWGNETFIASQYWPTPNYIIATAISAIITQTFLIWRFFRLSKSYVMAALLFLCALAALAGAIALAVVIVTHASLSERAMAQTTATIWFVSSAVTDIVIAMALIWQFRRIRSFFDNTQSLLRRLTSLTIKSGTVTSSVALTAFFLYLADKQANWATGVVFIIGPVYTLTMLSNLNSRRRLHGAGHTSDGPDESLGGRISNDQRTPEETFAMSGIHVIRTIQLNDDQNRRLKPDRILAQEESNEIDGLPFDAGKLRVPAADNSYIV